LLHDLKIIAAKGLFVPVEPVGEGIGNAVWLLLAAPSGVEAEFIARAAPAYLVAPVAFLLVGERSGRDVIEAEAVGPAAAGCIK
jgi:hypothetical protein